MKKKNSKEDWSASYTTGTSGEALAALPQAPLPMTTIDYYEGRADGGYSWDVKYDLSFDGTAFTVNTRLHLAGDDAGDYARIWEQGIESIWNNQYCLSDGTKSYAIRFDVEYVDAADAHYVVNVHDAYGRGDMLNWYTQTGWGPSYQDKLAAHEYGHMLGAFDEYAGGATVSNYTCNGTLMSDLTTALRPEYMHTIDFFAEYYTGQTFDVVKAPAEPPAPPQALTLRGGNGNDRLMGQDGDDTLYGNSGADQLHGGNGNDELFGGAGNDQLFGGAGNDRLRGNDGNDTLVGGAGADRFIIARGSHQDRITDFSYAEGDRLEVVGGLTYRVLNSNGSALIDFGNGDQVLLDGIGSSSVTRDWFEYQPVAATNDTLNGGAGNDRLLGYDGNDTLYGHAGADQLFGGNGADVLFGGAGNDQLFGEAGNDRLRGNDGNDTLTGGTGADRFIFARNSHQDRITDFSYAQGDRLELVGGLTYRVLDSSGSALVDFGNGDQVLLDGIASSSVTKDWFVYA